MHQNLTDEDEGTSLKEIRYKSFSKLVLMVVNLCLSPFYFGYSLAYLGSFDFDNIINIFGVTMEKNLANGLIQGCIPIGGGIGALTSFLLLRYLSRKQCILAINAVAFIVGVLILIPNQSLLFFTRFIQGICVGLYSAVIPLIIKQLSPTEISGSLGALNQFSIAFGVFFSLLFQYILMQINDQVDHWRIVFGFPLITIAIQTLLLLFVYKYETPRYQLQKKQPEKCRQILEYIYKQKFVDEVFAEKEQQANPKKQSIISNDAGKAQEDNEPQKVNKVRVFVALHLAILQQFVGINAVVAYGPQIAQKVFPDLANLIPVLLNLEQVLTSLTTSFLLSKLGRKTIMQAGTLAFVVSLAIISVGFFIKDSTQNVGNALIIIGLVIFMADFGLSLGPVVWLYIPEIVQPRIVPFSTGINWLCAAIVMILFPILQDKIGNPGPLFLFFGVWSFVSFFINQRFVIETKGKLQNQIFQEYQNR